MSWTLQLRDSGLKVLASIDLPLIGRTEDGTYRFGACEARFVRYGTMDRATLLYNGQEVLTADLDPGVRGVTAVVGQSIVCHNYSFQLPTGMSVESMFPVKKRCTCNCFEGVCASYCESQQ